MRLKWKRPLYLFHRWAGIVLCLFFALWFFSGVFMMYVEFPQLSPQERRAGLPALDFSEARLAPGEALARLQAGDFDTLGTPSRNLPQATQPGADPDAPVEAPIEAKNLQPLMRLGRPLYRIDADGPAQPRVVDAQSGALLPRVEAGEAQAIAADFAARAHGPALSPRYLDTVQTDQWTVSAALNAHRPLHVFALDDDAGTELYVSSSTGEVVRDSTRAERWLNYPAAVTHWLYPTLIRRYPDAWAWMVDILSGAGAVLAVSGIWIGLLRWKRRPRPGKSSIPYKGLMRWHHIGGLAFGIVTLTWVLSGLLSMNPGKLNPPRTPSAEQLQVFSGKPLTPADFTLPRFDGDIVEAQPLHYLAQPLWQLTHRDGRVELRSSNGQTPTLPDAAAMRARAALLLPDAVLREVQTLHDYDDYYYTRHPQNGTHPLPALRVRFADADASWFHLDPASGRILDRSTRRNRLYRWLYNGLHSFDLWWLWQHRPLWDIAVIGFSLGGFALSITGIVIGWRRLRFDRSAGATMQRSKRRGAPSAGACDEAVHAARPMNS